MRFDVVEPFKHLRVTYDGERCVPGSPARARRSEARVHLLTRTSRCSSRSTTTGSARCTAARRRCRTRRWCSPRGTTEQHVKAVGQHHGERQADGVERVRPARSLVGPALMAIAEVLPLADLSVRRNVRLHGLADRHAERHRAALRFRLQGRREPLREYAHSCTPTASGEGHYHDRIATTLHTTAGDFEITGQVLTMLPLRNRRDGKVTRIAEGMTEWRCGDARRLRAVGVPGPDRLRRPS